MYFLPTLEQLLYRSRNWGRREGAAWTFRRKTIDALTKRLHNSGREFRMLNVDGIQVTFDVSDLAARYNYFAAVPYEPETSRFLLERLSAGKTFVDVGANHGYFTVLAAKCVGLQGIVYAFEPNPGTVERLRKHLVLNGVKNRVAVVETALSDVASERVEFFVGTSAENSSYSSLSPSQFALDHGLLSRERTIAAATDTFDAWIARTEVREIDVMKIDVEGAELSVLTGMQQALAAQIPRSIVCETTWGGDAHRFLESHGYRARALECAANGFGNILFELK